MQDFKEGLTDGCFGFFPPKHHQKGDYEAPGISSISHTTGTGDTGHLGRQGQKPTWAATLTQHNEELRGTESLNCTWDSPLARSRARHLIFPSPVLPPRLAFLLPSIPQSSIFCCFSDLNPGLLLKCGEINEQT